MNGIPGGKRRSGYSIYINTQGEGPLPVVSDEDGYSVFETVKEAQRGIVDGLMVRLRQFLDGEREYEDAITVEEYVVPVTMNDNGSFVDIYGNTFGLKR